MIFETKRCVKELLGMSDWPRLLMTRQITNAQIGEFVVLRPTKGVAATFGCFANEAAITYDPQLVAKPLKDHNNIRARIGAL